MDVMRRFHEQSPTGRGVKPSVQPDTSATSVARLLSLQATAGNRAVAALLEVQREPAQMELLERTIADRITEAWGRVTKGEIDASAFEHYRTSTAGTVAEVAALLWQNELHFVDLDPAGAAIDKKADKKLVADFKAFLEARVLKALTAKLNDLIKQVRTSGTKLADQVELILKESPMWEEGPVTDRLFVEWVGPVPISRSSPAGASDLWSALKDASSRSVASKRTDHLSKTAVKALDPAELSAVKTLLDPSTTWVVSPEDTADLTDQAAAALGRPINRADMAWKELRDRMSTLILAAESDIINQTIPQSKKIPLVPTSWATFRNRYVGTLTKPMWAFYRDNIVDAEILGEKVKASTDSSGVHKDVAAVLPLLEESARRLGGFATKADLIKANQRPGSEFRFEAMSHPDWMGKARHLSFHGTGRAMDFRAGKNPAFGGPTHELVSILGGGELSELSAGSHAQRQDLQKVATSNANMVRQRDDLQKRQAAATDDQEKAQLQSDIDRINAHLRDSVQTDPMTVKVRDRATETHQKVKRIESKFLTSWATITLMRKFPLGEALASLLIGAQVDAAADAARQALAAAQKAESPDVKQIEDRIKRIDEVRTLLKNPAASIRETNQKQMLKKVDELSKSGLTDMPSWMVQAFAERGWQWGMWEDFADAMHFDYMGPVADVRSDAQYH
jgi:nucleoid-associated protein YgaU